MGRKPNFGTLSSSPKDIQCHPSTETPLGAMTLSYSLQASPPIPLYNFPGTWTDAYTSTKHATRNIVSATSSFAHAIADSGIRQAGTAVARAALVTGARAASKAAEVVGPAVGKIGGPAVEKGLEDLGKRVLGEERLEKKKGMFANRRKRTPPHPDESAIAMVLADETRLPHQEYARAAMLESRSASLVDGERRGRSRTARGKERKFGRPSSRIYKERHAGQPFHYTDSGDDSEGGLGIQSGDLIDPADLNERAPRALKGRNCKMLDPEGSRSIFIGQHAVKYTHYTPARNVPGLMEDNEYDEDGDLLLDVFEGAKPLLSAPVFTPAPPHQSAVEASPYATPTSLSSQEDALSASMLAAAADDEIDLSTYLE